MSRFAVYIIYYYYCFIFFYLYNYFFRYCLFSSLCYSPEQQTRGGKGDGVWFLMFCGEVDEGRV